MALRLGDKAPNFIAETTQGKINFHDWLGSSWGILFSHPRDFTPVCTTELGAVAKLQCEFQKRNVKVIAISIDFISDHKNWILDINETQNTKVNFPLIADPDRRVAIAYDMIYPHAIENATVRSVFVISPDKKINLILSYPASTGRSFEEIIRVIDSMQLAAKYNIATPANWKDGDNVIIIPAIKDEEIAHKFPKGYTKIKPYLRVTSQPNK